MLINSVISLEESILFDGYTPGRRSFRGFNPLIEALTTERQAEDLLTQAKKEADESDHPIESFSNMAKRPSTKDQTRMKSKARANSQEKAREMERMLTSTKQDKKNKDKTDKTSIAKVKPIANKMHAGKKK